MRPWESLPTIPARAHGCPGSMDRRIRKIVGATGKRRVNAARWARSWHPACSGSLGQPPGTGTSRAANDRAPRRGGARSWPHVHAERAFGLRLRKSWGRPRRTTRPRKAENDGTRGIMAGHGHPRALRARLASGVPQGPRARPGGPPRRAGSRMTEPEGRQSGIMAARARRAPRAPGVRRAPGPRVHPGGPPRRAGPTMTEPEGRRSGIMAARARRAPRARA